MTYSSSDATIAEVDNSGNITGHKKGNVTITATAAGDAEHKPGSANYALTVTSSAPVITTTYYLASSIEAGKSYVIVSDGKALKNDNGSATAVGVTVNSGSIQVEGDVTSLLWAASTDPDKASAFRFTNNDQTLRRSSGNVSIGNPSSSAYNNQWTYSSSSKHVMLERSSTQTYYLYYNEGWKANETVGEALLYTTEPGSNPGGGDDPEPSTYTRVSFADGISTGSYLIVNPADAMVFTTVTGNPNAAEVSPVSGTITGSFASYELTITKNGDNYTIQNGSGQYLYYVYTSGDTQTRVAYDSATKNWTLKSVSDDANGFDLNYASGNGQHMYWNSTFFKIGSQSTGVHLYKKSDNP